MQYLGYMKGPDKVEFSCCEEFRAVIVRVNNEGLFSTLLSELELTLASKIWEEVWENVVNDVFLIFQSTDSRLNRRTSIEYKLA